MSLVPVEGQTYRYTGDLRSHHGLYGVASNIYPVGRLYRLTLSNHADWARCGLAPSLECLSSEISPAEPAEPLDPTTTDDRRGKPQVLAHDGEQMPVLGQWYRARASAGNMEKGQLIRIEPLDNDWDCLIQLGRWSGWYLASELEPAQAPDSCRSLPAKTTTDDLPKRTVTVERDLFTGPEKELVKESCDWLTKNGFAWAVAGQYKAKGSGTTEGFPDLWVRHPVWPRGLWVAIELKTATGTLSPEQERLHDAGGSHVCRSIGQVSEVAYAIHNALCGWLALVKYR